MSCCPNSVQLGLVTDKPYHWLQGSLRLWISYFGHSLHLLCPFHHHQLCFLIYILVFFIIFFFRERFFQELRTPVSQDFPFYSDNFTVWLVFTPTLSTWWSSSAHSKINFLLSSRLRSVRGSELTGSFWLHPSPTTTYCHTVLAPLRHNRLLQWLLLLCGHTILNCMATKKKTDRSEAPNKSVVTEDRWFFPSGPPCTLQTWSTCFFHCWMKSTQSCRLHRSLRSPWPDCCCCCWSNSSF